MSWTASMANPSSKIVAMLNRPFASWLLAIKGSLLVVVYFRANSAAAAPRCANAAALPAWTQLTSLYGRIAVTASAALFARSGDVAVTNVPGVSFAIVPASFAGIGTLNDT